MLFLTEIFFISGLMFKRNAFIILSFLLLPAIQLFSQHDRLIDNARAELKNRGEVYFCFAIKKSYPVELLTELLSISGLNNDTVFAYAGDNEISVDVDGFNTNKLTLTFDLINATEIYDEIIVSLSKSDSQGSYLYSDLYPNEEIVFLDVDAGEDRTVKVNQSVQFTGTASGGTAPYTWEWYFDGDEIIDSTNQNPTFKFTEPGTYDVELNVYDSGEGVGIAYLTVTVTGTNGGNGNGDNGLPSTDSGSGLIIFIILIVIIIVVAVAVVVYVIKK